MGNTDPKPRRRSGTRLLLWSAALLAALWSACASTPADRAIDRAHLNPEVSPGVDFYRYANGGWMERHPVPPTESAWGAEHEVLLRNQRLLRGILEEAEQDGGAPGSPRQLLGDLYASAMDERAVEAAGAEPLSEARRRIDHMRSVDELPAVLGHLHGIGVAAFFSLTTLPDYDDTTRILASVRQDGMGLPGRSFYLKDDPELARIREGYEAHVGHMFELFGDRAGEARRRARLVLAIETRLARAALDSAARRDPAEIVNKTTPAAADARSPSFSWTSYLDTVGLGRVESFNLTGPSYFAGLDRLLGALALEECKSYLTWHLLRTYAPELSRPFVEESFAFEGRLLAGRDALPERWRRVLETITGSALGEALGRLFVERAFQPEARERARAMVDDLVAAYRARLARTSWMSAETRERALAKLDAMGAKIGYPERWRSYSGLLVDRDSWVRNLMRIRSFQFRHELSRVGGPPEEGTWSVPPHVVNAFYDPHRNEIVLPAGILQPPFFSPAFDDAVNFGAIGTVIGHEITHGFDDTGSRFDARGRLRDWWTAEDRAEFKRRAQRLAEQFSEYEAASGRFVDGELTLGENLADLGGLAIAWDGLQLALEEHPAEPIADFTPEQRFFLSYAQCWRRNVRPEALALQLRTGPHAPAHFRTVGPLSNMPQFARAFDLEADAPMVRPASARVEVW